MEPNFLSSIRGYNKAHRLQLGRFRLDIRNFSLGTGHSGRLGTLGDFQDMAMQSHGRPALILLVIVLLEIQVGLDLLQHFCDSVVYFQDILCGSFATP